MKYFFIPIVDDIDPDPYYKTGLPNPANMDQYLTMNINGYIKFLDYKVEYSYFKFDKEQPEIYKVYTKGRFVGVVWSAPDWDTFMKVVYEFLDTFKDEDVANTNDPTERNYKKLMYNTICKWKEKEASGV